MVLSLAGAWCLDAHPPSLDDVEREIEAATPSRVAFDTRALGAWDSAILTFLIRVVRVCRDKKIEVDRAGNP